MVLLPRAICPCKYVRIAVTAVFWVLWPRLIPLKVTHGMAMVQLFDTALNVLFNWYTIYIKPQKLLYFIIRLVIIVINLLTQWGSFLFLSRVIPFVPSLSLSQSSLFSHRRRLILKIHEVPCHVMPTCQGSKLQKNFDCWTPKLPQPLSLAPCCLWVRLAISLRGREGCFHIVV